MFSKLPFGYPPLKTLLLISDRPWQPRKKRLGSGPHLREASHDPFVALDSLKAKSGEAISLPTMTDGKSEQLKRPRNDDE